MRRQTKQARRRPTFQPMAIAAAAALLLGSVMPAQSQSFSQSGANSTNPSNLLPFGGSPTSLDFSGNRMFVGAGGLGSFSALAGAVLNADSLTLATGSTDIGTFTASGVQPGAGARTQVLLGGGGQVNRLEVGNWGIGTLTISGGALLDATVNPGGCTVSSWCYTFIGNAAGSTATVTITGVDPATNTPSELRALRNFTVGQTSVFTTANSGFDFGTPGATTNATVNVLAGGRLSTERAVVGSNNHSPDGLGTEKANGTVVVSGTGSQWVLKHNSIDVGQSAGLFIGNSSGGTGTVTVSNGGKLTVDSSATPVTANAFINIGQSGGKGTLTVTGTGSVLELINGGAIQVGRTGIASVESSFSVLAGATATATFLNVGRDGPTGKVFLDGAGSSLVLSGQGPYSSGGTGPAFATIGWAGVGQVTVSNGAVFRITDGYDTSALSGRGPGFNVGINSGLIGGTGLLTIDGVGSLMEVVSTSIAPASGAGDNWNPAGYIGNGAGSTGTVEIKNGGKLLMTGNANSTAAFSRGTNLNIGGTSDSAVGGTGTVTITGFGSELRVAGADPFIAVGRNGTGTLSLSNQALVETRNMNVGRGKVDDTNFGDGTLLMDNSTLLLTGQQTGANPSGAALSIGNRGGTGRATITNGSQVMITNLGSLGATLNLGGTGPNPLGNGELTLSAGSQIKVVAGAGLASMTVGRDGTGKATITGGSLVDLGDGGLHVGRLANNLGVPLGDGTLILNGGSQILAGTAQFGGSSDDPLARGGKGQGTISGLGTELKASGPYGFVGVGRGGTGILEVSSQAKVSAITMSVGRALGGSGTLTVDNASIELAGQTTLGNIAGASLAIGIAGGNGVASLLNGSRLSINNLGNAPTGVVIGGAPGSDLTSGTSFSSGNGTLSLGGGSEMRITAAAGQANLSVGYKGTDASIGTGTVLMTGASLIDVGNGTVNIGHHAGSQGSLVMTQASTLNAVNGSVYVGRDPAEPPSAANPTGTPAAFGSVLVTGGSTINAGFLGLGVSQPYDKATNTQYVGGAGVLVLNDSTINADKFEIGAGSVLTGNNGTLNVVGDVVIGGTISPGNSPGKLRIRCNIIMLPGSRIVLEVSGSGDNLADYEFDQLIIGDDASFDLASAEIVFSFLGNTNPNVVSALGGLDLNNYLRAGSEAPNAPIDGPTQALSTQFALGKTWADVINTSKISAVSESASYSNISIAAFGPDGTVQVVAVPEPATWGMLFLGFAAVVGMARRQRRQD